MPTPRPERHGHHGLWLDNGIGCQIDRRVLTPCNPDSKRQCQALGVYEAHGVQICHYDWRLAKGVAKRKYDLYSLSDHLRCHDSPVYRTWQAQGTRSFLRQAEDWAVE